MSNLRVVRACLITNPRGGKGEIDLSTVLPVLAAHGWIVEVRQKLHGGHATELARDAVNEGFDVIVAAGGDGTVGEIVDGVAGGDVAVGVLPGGTANLWAHEIGVSMDLGAAALQLVGAQRRRIDVGHFTINGKHGEHFLLMAGLGIDAAVLAKLSKPLKKKVGALAYLPAIGRALPQATPFAVHVDLDGVAWDGEVVQIVVGNTRRYAEVTSVTPDAVVDDGRLDICLLMPADPVSALGQISTLLLRQHPNQHSSLNDRVGQLTVRTSTVTPLQVDGGRVKQDDVDVTGEGVDYAFTVRAQALTVLVPRDYSGTLFQAAPVSASLGGTAGHGGKCWFRVAAVGVDAITAARLKDGQVRTIRVVRKADLIDANGDKQPSGVFLSSLATGDLIKVRGKKDRKRAVILARKVTVANVE